MKKYPFKFLDAYTPEDTDIFFGRDEEIDALYKMVFQSDILLVYGASGTGKTSLLKCGLASRFAAHDWLPIYIRRGSDINEALQKALEEAAGEQPTPEGELDWLGSLIEEEGVETASPRSPLQATFKSIYLNYFRPIYLIFDQFEELYILGSQDEQRQFIQSVQDILAVEQPVKLLFSIREEYLGHLYAFERAVPQLLRKKLRVEPMNYDKVQQVITGATSYADSNVHLQKGQATEVAEQIFHKIKGEEKSLTIPLPYLQVFLDKLYLSITGDEQRQADATFTTESVTALGEIGDVLRDFLDDQTEAISRELKKQYPEATTANIWKLLSPFATLEGTKEPMAPAQLHARLPELSESMVDEAVKHFVDRRILRYAEDTGLYEIAHDSLAQRIAEKRSDEEIARLEVRRLIRSQTALKMEAREYFTEKQLSFIEPFLEQLDLTEAEKNWIEQSRKKVAAEKEAEARRQREELAATRRRLRVVRGLLVLAVIALVGAGYFWNDARLKEQRANQLLQENITKDSLNRMERFGRFMSEARGLEQQRNYEEAISRYELAAEFTQDSATVTQAIADCRAASERERKYEELLTTAAEAETAESYGQAVDRYEQAVELIGLRPKLREQLTNFRNTIRDEARKAGENANALSYDPKRAGKYRQNAQRFNALANRLNGLLQKEVEK